MLSKDVTVQDKRFTKIQQIKNSKIDGMQYGHQ